MDKMHLFLVGKIMVVKFCQINSIETPEIQEHEQTHWRFGTCAYYRPTITHICVKKCAHRGTAGRQWSYPGYVVDRTPYGVLAHELGHHVDVLRGTNKQAYWSDFSEGLRASSQEAPITSYAPNTAEWFAEIFRLYLTNPDLLGHIRPKVSKALAKLFKPAEGRSWEQVLEGAPERTIEAARKKVGAGQGRLL